MHKHLLGFLAAALFVFDAAMPVCAQNLPTFDSLTLVLVSTKDGNEFIGTLVAQNDEKIVLQTSNFGELSIQRNMVTKIRATQPPKVVNGKVWFRNPHAPRHFAGPSAYGLEKGESSFDNTFLFFNQLSYGLSDHFSLGAGFAPLTLFDSPFSVWITPKISVPLKKDVLNVAVGGLYGHSYSNYESDDQDFGAVYSQLTLGSRDANLSAGLAVVSKDNQWQNNSLLSFSGMVRAGRWLSFIGESYISLAGDDNLNLYGLGFRLMWPHVAFDAGVTIVSESNYDTYPMPWGSFHVSFGRSRN